MTLVPLSADFYYTGYWRSWLHDNVGYVHARDWGVIVLEDGTADRYVELYFKSPEDATLFRLKFNVQYSCS